MPHSVSRNHLEEKDTSCLLLLRFYLMTLVELSVEREQAASETLEKRNISAKYQEAIQQYHHLKEQYDHQYSQQYQQYFSLPIPCFNWQLIDETLQLVDFNPMAARFCYESLGQDGVNIGQTPEKTFLGLPALYRYLHKYYQLGVSASHRLQFAHLDLYLRVEYVFIAPDQALMFIINESEQVLTELKLRRKVRQQSAIAKLGQISLGSDNLEKFLNQAVVFVARTLGVDYCSLYSVQPNVPSCLLRAGYGWPVDLVGEVTVSTQASRSHVGQTLAEQTAVVIEDLRLETRFKGETLLHNYRIVSGLSALIGMPEQPWGVLGVYTVETRSFADDEMHFLQAIAHIVNGTVERFEHTAQMNLLHRSIDAIAQGVVITDPRQEHNPLIYVNQGFDRITGYTKAEVIGKNCNFLQGRETNQQNLNQLREAIMRGQPHQTTVRNFRKNGEPFWNQLQIFPVRDNSGCLTNFIGIQTDITEQKAAADRLHKTEDQFRSTFELAPIGMAITNLEGDYIEVNQSLCNILGYDLNELLTLNYADITHADDMAEDLRVNQELATGKKNQFQREKRYITKDGKVIFALLQAVLVKKTDGTPLHVIRQMVDISDRKNMEQRLVHDALYDNLTGLPNRTLLHERLLQSLKHYQRYANHEFAVLFLDLDHFKWVNDSLGHHVGDLLLKAFAKRVQDCLRETDTLARLGGDEFVVLLDEIHRKTYALQISERIHEVLQEPFHLADKEVFMDVSIGILQGQMDYENPEAVLRDADVAMYQAKSMGRSRSEVFDTRLQEQMIQRRHLEDGLREAIAEESFVMRYQPIFDLGTGEMVGVAAQINWHHPDDGWISPSSFLAIAEETGLINPLSRWLIHSACADLKQLQNQGGNTPLKLHLAISARQLRGVYLIDLLEALPSEYDFPLDQLVLEFRETVFAKEEQEIRQQFIQLRQLGVKIFLDGFGTSNMSLSSIYHQLVHGLILEPETLKESWMETAGDRHEVLEAMVSLANSLNLRILARGIQTQEQWQILEKLHCSFGQLSPLDQWQTLEEITQLLSQKSALFPHSKASH
jgi:diguanylate cyclase (GGDEF)-like protein/PAS domain S-box-containing protein